MVGKNKERQQRRKAQKKEERRKRRRADEADALNTRLEELRTLLHEGPSAHNWDDLCKLFQRWPDDETLEFGLDYADAHLDAWPDALRVATGVAAHWMSRALDGHPWERARLRLVRVGHLKGAHYTTDRVRELINGAYLPRLVGLGLRGLALSDCFDVFDKGELEHLSILDLSVCFLTDRELIELFELVSFERLEQLDLRENRLSDRGLRRLFEIGVFDHITHLDLSKNFLGGEALAAVLASSWSGQLESLILDGIALNASALERLCTSPLTSNIRRLSLDSCRLDPRSCAILTRVEWPSLERLDLGDNSITNPDLASLAELHAPRLEELHLSNNRLTSAVTRLLTTSTRFAELDVIDLRGNPFDAILVGMLLHNRLPTRVTVRVDATSRSFSDTIPLLLDLVDDAPLQPQIEATFFERLRGLDNQLYHVFVKTALLRDGETLPPILRKWWSAHPDQLERLTVTELRRVVKVLGARGYSGLRRDELLDLARSRL